MILHAIGILPLGIGFLHLLHPLSSVITPHTRFYILMLSFTDACRICVTSKTLEYNNKVGHGRAISFLRKYKTIPRLIKQEERSRNLTFMGFKGFISERLHLSYCVTFRFVVKIHVYHTNSTGNFVTFMCYLCYATQTSPRPRLLAI